MKLHPSKDMQVTAALATVCAAIALMPGPSAARLPAGLLLALCLPGYGLARLLLPGRSLGRAELAACVLGLSLGAVALGGLLLNIVPGHLGRPAWAIFLATLTVACCAVASLRKPDEPGQSYRALASRVAAKAAAAGRLRVPPAQPGDHHPDRRGTCRVRSGVDCWSTAVDTMAQTAGGPPCPGRRQSGRWHPY